MSESKRQNEGPAGHGHECCAHSDHAEDAHPAPAADARLIFKVEGLDCAEEVSVLRRVVGPLVGGADNLAFDVLNGRMLILSNAAPVSPDAVRDTVRATGMSATEWLRENGKSESAPDSRRAQQAWFTGFSALAVFAGFVIHVWSSGGLLPALGLLAHSGQSIPLPEVIAYALAIGFGVRFTVLKAWFALRQVRPDMNLLMVIAVAGAVVIGEWFEAATVACLFSLSLTLESWSVGRARRAIAALLDLAPPLCRVILPGGEEKDIPAENVPVGTLFIVRPGDRIPLDGRVVSGCSAVNQAPITGESIPVTKDAGAEVFAGTVNGEGALQIESSKAADDTTLARIINLVEQAQGRRAQAEQWVEKFARVYTPGVILLAFAIFVIPPLLFDAAWAEWFYRALVLLVIACPCALVISTPVSIVAALAAAARNGVLIKGGSYIEQPAALSAIAFDKTGTLTQGRPAVVSVVPLNGHTEAELLERAAALEARSSHPLARAIIEYAQAKKVRFKPVEDAQLIPGKGVTGRFNGEEYWLGSHRYLLQRRQETAEVAQHTAAMQRNGSTVIVIGNTTHVCGLIAVADSVRPGAAEALRALRAAGVKHLIMLTGDNRVTAQAIARETGIDEVHAELLPQDKVEAIEALTLKYGTVAMVGDGVNDAPAMARASFGIAMGAAGSDAAIETADIALMTDDLSRLPWLVAHSKRTLSVIRANIVFALGIKLLFVCLTFAGMATLWGAIAADVGASLVVVTNALRLLNGRVVGADGTALPHKGG
jgi:Cd2+/Zn2+-exporting ATPase